MLEIIKHEAIYLWYYFDIQVRQIFWYWVLGILIGSAISVFAKNWIHSAAEFLGQKIPGIVGLIFASALGIASPLCMYGTIPICAAFSKKGIKDDFLAAFMMSSILLNPQLIIYSTALGGKILAVRIVSCFVCGVVAGLLVRLFYVKKEMPRGCPYRVSDELNNFSLANRSKADVFDFANAKSLNFKETPLGGSNPCGTFFDFSSFEDPRNNDTDKNIWCSTSIF